MASRVEILEENVASLAELPERVARIASQILQFRDEVRGEFSAIRAEIRAGDEETRRHMRVLYEDLVAKRAVLGNGRDRPRKRR
jgi:hypothetical protein